MAMGAWLGWLWIIMGCWHACWCGGMFWDPWGIDTCTKHTDHMEEQDSAGIFIFLHLQLIQTSDVGSLSNLFSIQSSNYLTFQSSVDLSIRCSQEQDVHNSKIKPCQSKRTGQINFFSLFKTQQFNNDKPIRTYLIRRHWRVLDHEGCHVISHIAVLLVVHQVLMLRALGRIWHHSVVTFSNIRTLQFTSIEII